MCERACTLRIPTPNHKAYLEEKIERTMDNTYGLGRSLLLISMMAIIQSCNSQPSGDNERSVINKDSAFKTDAIVPNSNENKSTFPPRFLDTLKLMEMGITCQKISSNKYYDEWLLRWTDTIPKSKQIRALTYNIIIHTRNEYEDLTFQLDSLLIHLQNNTQTFGFDGVGAYFHSYDELLTPDITFDDYNFDEILDISIYSGASGNSNETRDYFIFNPKLKKFNPSIVMNNASFDKTKKLVYQSSNGGGGNGGMATFKFTKSDTLIMIKSVGKQYNHDLEAFVRETKILNGDGTYSINMDTVKN